MRISFDIGSRYTVVLWKREGGGVGVKVLDAEYQGDPAIEATLDERELVLAIRLVVGHLWRED